MPKRTIILILIITIIALLLVVAAFMQLRKPKEEQQTTPDTTQNTLPDTTRIAERLASLSFSQSTATVSSVPTQVEILADSGGLEITGVQIELEYDPTKLSNVALIPVASNGLFGTSGQVLINEVRSTAGRVSYAVVINPTANPVKGIGSIVGLSLTAAPGATGQTQIKFLDKSVVSSFSSQESVLKGTVPLNITLSNFAPVNNNPLPQNPPVTPTQ